MFVFVSIDLVRRKISVTFYDLSVGKNKDILSYSTYSAFSYNLHIFHVRHTRYSVLDPRYDTNYHINLMDSFYYVPLYYYGLQCILGRHKQNVHDES
jgi:hypothetical protein